jgi:drug/metabolite transporter (DMT)-like permease
MRRYRCSIAAVTAIIFWSLSFVGTKLSYVSFGPLTVCFLRFAASYVILFFVRVIRHDHQKLQKKDIGILLASALVGISVYYSLENFALSLTSASNASLISGSYPVITALIGVFFYHMKLERKQWLGIFLAMIGVFVLTGGGSNEGSHVMLGNLIFIANGFLWGFYNFLIPHIDHHYSTLTITYYQTLLALPFLVPGMLYELPVQSVQPSAVAAVLFLAVCCSAAAYLLYNYGLKGIAPSTAASLMNLMPIFGLIFSALILGETITLQAVIGGVIIIIGVLMSA